VGCLVCAAGGIPVWMTEDGEFCHWDERCSGMENALQIMESEALAAGKQYCPVCLSGAGAASVSAAVASEPAASATVWVKEEDALFYHTDEYCASRLTVEEFAGGGKKPCGACGADGLDDADMAYSDDGVYHAVSNCAERTRFQPCDLDKAEESGRAACPVCMREAYEQTVSYYTGSVWLTDEGEYYHRARNCNGLHGAYSREWLEAVNLDKRACQVCMNEDPVWINDDNPYYHLFEKCGYGQNDSEIAEAEALSEGRRPCPMCLPNRIDSAIAEKFILQAEAEGLEVLVGKEAAYHADESCSAIEADEDGHTIARETVALGWGKVPCDECLAVRYETLDEVDYIEIGQRLKPDEGELWMTEGGKFYHTDMHCSGMKNASSCDVIGALKSGKQPCPTCAEQFAEVWATENGRVYHLSGDCMGIVGAMKLTGAEAVQKGLTLCEACLGELIDALNEGV